MPDIKSFLQENVKRAKRGGITTALEAMFWEAYHYNKNYLNKKFAKATLIWEENWDVCVIIDGCRYDIFKDNAWRHRFLDNAEIDYKYSPASASPEFISKTFDSLAHRDMSDSSGDSSVGIVSSNPFFQAPEKAPEWLGEEWDTWFNRFFEEKIFLGEEKWNLEIQNSELPVIDPQTVTNCAWKANKEWNVDKLIIWYMQPHSPFKNKPEWYENRDSNDNVWEELRREDKNQYEVWNAYKTNLNWVLREIQRLLMGIEGKYLLTSDHGQAFGEKGLYGHPAGMWTKELRQIPWITFEYNHEKGKPHIEEKDIDKQLENLKRQNKDIDITKQLEYLGYK